MIKFAAFFGAFRSGHGKNAVVVLLKRILIPRDLDFNAPLPDALKVSIRIFLSCDGGRN